MNWRIHPGQTTGKPAHGRVEVSHVAKALHQVLYVAMVSAVIYTYALGIDQLYDP